MRSCLSSFLIHLDCTGAMIRDILFYICLLMVLPLLAANHDKFTNWLWWYPPHLRRMRIFRLRRLVGFFAIWCMVVTPIIIIHDRSQGPSPPIRAQGASPGGSVTFWIWFHAWLTRLRLSRRGWVGTLTDVLDAWQFFNHFRSYCTISSWICFDFSLILLACWLIQEEVIALCHSLRTTTPTRSSFPCIRASNIATFIITSTKISQHLVSR